MKNTRPSKQAHLLDHLARRGEAETVELRRLLDIGNVGQTAARLNAKLAASGDPRRVVCRHSGRRYVWVLDTTSAS